MLYYVLYRPIRQGRGPGSVIARNYIITTNKLLNPSRRVRYARATIHRTTMYRVSRKGS